MASYQDCIAVLNDAVGEVLTEEQKKALLDSIHELAEKKKSALGADDIDTALFDAIDEKGSEHVLSAIIDKRNKMLNLKAKKRILGYIGQFENPVEGLKAYMAGTVKLRTGGRFSVDAQGKALSNKYLGRVIADLEKENLLPIFTSGELDRLVARELWEIKPDGNPGITQNADARKIAEIIHKYQTIAIDRQNRAGAFIRKLPGYIVRQSHAMEKVRRAGFDEWKKFILPRLDSKTFEEIDAEPEEFLKSAFEAISSGVHLKARGAEQSNHILGFTGPKNVAKRLSAERLLHFKDADSWLDYNNEFGTTNMREAFVYGLEHAARNTVLMESFGTNPLTMFTNIKNGLLKEHRTNPKIVQQLNAEPIQSIFNEIEGTSRIPVNLSAARISAGWRSITNMAKLGGATISSITDIPFQVAELRYQGISGFKAYANAFSSLFHGRGNAERREIARLLGVGFEGLQNDIMSRFSATDHIPGTMAKLQQRFFKLNLMSWWNDSHKTGVGHIMSNHLAEQSNKSFNKLDDDTKRIFKLYDINDAEWDEIRKTVWTAESGNRYITPDKIAQMSDDQIKKLIKFRGKKSKATPRQIAEFRDALESKLSTYFVDRADFAVPVPGAAERAFMNRGTSPGTVMGEVLRFFFQFKSFPITVIHRALGRDLFGHGADNFKEALFKGKGDMLGIANLIVSTTLFGYGSMMLKDLAKGREPREFSGKTVLAAMAQGGGLGIYGDFLFGEYSRYGNSALVTLMGPTMGQFDDVIGLYQAVRDGDPFAANVLRIAMNNTPFINLFYTRLALDYLILYRVMEMANPGYLRRMERRLKKDNNQRYIVPPSEVIERGGGL